MEPGNGRCFEKIADEIIAPIMQVVHETAFVCLETEKGLVPIGTKDGILESLEKDSCRILGSSILLLQCVCRTPPLESKLYCYIQEGN